MKLRVFLMSALVALALAGCGKTERLITLSTTIGPVDAGIIGLMEEEFEKETGIRVRHISAGTGAAINAAKKGGIDMVIAHSKKLEEKFVADGFGLSRIPLMYNDFVILGPANDPAGIKGMKSAPDAFKKISEKKAKFLTRGDKSGTHMSELEVWEKSGITPKGDWYEVYAKGFEGNKSTILYADKNNLYLLMDRATYLSVQKEIKLAILVEKDEVLLNYISIVPVNPAKIKGVNKADADVFINWLTDPAKGQKIVKEFGVAKYGQPMFFPNSERWHKSVKK